MTTNTCPKCGGKMDIHYGEWCPMCDKPELVNIPIYDFFRVARYIAAHEGYNYSGSHEDCWVRRVLDQIEFPSNDCYIDHFVTIDNPEYALEDEMIQFNNGLNKYFGLQDETNILLNISW